MDNLPNEAFRVSGTGRAELRSALAVIAFGDSASIYVQYLNQYAPKKGGV
jgi:hypothetical protein